MLPSGLSAGVARPPATSPGSDSAASSISDEGLVHSIYRLKQAAASSGAPSWRTSSQRGGSRKVVEPVPALETSQQASVQMTREAPGRYEIGNAVVQLEAQFAAAEAPYPDTVAALDPLAAAALSPRSAVKQQVDSSPWLRHVQDFISRSPTPAGSPEGAWRIPAVGRRSSSGGLDPARGPAPAPPSGRRRWRAGR
ncbi:hypothetical protein WJX81_000419 [Elliptochloris bilobata]|uniref:Uncharacterized protein n=1 Tax=Elliptochloris bilobata TaxID=381761 RepID=A0AAW1S043_9CHLO